MENATKALLIAAAILIAIVLISIGVFVLRQGQEAVDSVNMSETEMLAFNSKFTSYEGKQRGSNVNALAQTVLSNNVAAAAEGSTSTKGVEMTGKGINISADGKTNTDTTVESTGAYYTVKIEYKNGLVSKISVTE